MDNPITFPKDFDEGFFRLPKYVVSFSTQREPHILHFNDVDHCSARLEIILSREVKSYLLENYLPSTLFVSMSWGSFVVVPEIVPGRMVMTMTNNNSLFFLNKYVSTFLILTFAGTFSNNSTITSYNVRYCSK